MEEVAIARIMAIFLMLFKLILYNSTVVVGPHNKDFPVRPGSRQVTVNVRVLEGSIEPGEHLIVHFSTKDKTAKGAIVD